MQKPKPEGFGKLVSNRLKNTPQSPETIAKRVAKTTGKKRTKEQKEKGKYERGNQGNNC